MWIDTINRLWDFIHLARGQGLEHFVWTQTKVSLENETMGFSENAAQCCGLARKMYLAGLLTLQVLTNAFKASLHALHMSFLRFPGCCKTLPPLAHRCLAAGIPGTSVSSSQYLPSFSFSSLVSPAPPPLSGEAEAFSILQL